MILSTGCLEADQLMIGGVRTGVSTMFFGPPMWGKSFLSHQVAWRSSCPVEEGGLNRPALIIDTENYWTPEVQTRHASFMQSRFPNGGKIDYMSTTGLGEFFALWGLRPVITVKEDKIEASVEFLDEMIKDEEDKRKKVGMKSHIQACPIWKACEEKHYGMIIIDSITNPLKARISVAKVQNLASREAVMGPLSEVFGAIEKTFDTGILYTDHYTKSPINPQDMGVAWGGDFLIYNTKYIYGLFPGVKDLYDKFGDGARRLFRTRQSTYPGHSPRNPQFAVINLAKDQGFVSLGIAPSGNKGKAI